MGQELMEEGRRNINIKKFMRKICFNKNQKIIN